MTERTAANVVPRNRYVIFCAIALGGCLADLLTKHWMFQWLGMPHEHPGYWLIDNVFGFQTSLNEGALFGIGQGGGKVFVTLSLVAGVGVVYWLFYLGAASDRLITVALSCVMAGTLGNLYDRLGMPGLIWNYGNKIHARGDAVFAVRDFVYFKLIEWPIFNIADSLLVCGAAMLVWHAFIYREPSTTPDTSTR